MLKIDIFCHFLSFLNKFSYFCSRIVQPDRCCRCKTSSFMITESAAYAALSVVKSTMTYLYESGLWVGRQSRHNGRRLSTLCLRRTEIQQIHGNIIVLNVVNGRCPGCDYINPVETCKHGLYPFGRSQMCYIGLFTDMIFISAWALTLSVRQ